MSVIKTIIFIVSLLSTLFIMGCDMKKDPTQEKSENKNELKEKFIKYSNDTIHGK